MTIERRGVGLNADSGVMKDENRRSDTSEEILYEKNFDFPTILRLTTQKRFAHKIRVTDMFPERRPDDRSLEGKN